MHSDNNTSHVPVKSRADLLISQLSEKPAPSAVPGTASADFRAVFLLRAMGLASAAAVATGSATASGCRTAAEADRAGSVVELTFAPVSAPAGVGGSGVSPGPAMKNTSSETCCAPRSRSHALTRCANLPRTFLSLHKRKDLIQAGSRPVECSLQDVLQWKQSYC